jgi:hydrogenase expression/formation protein HypD
VKAAQHKPRRKLDEGVMERALLGKVNGLVAELCKTRKTINLMEVCGTHTMAISGFGIRRAVDPRLRLLSGPGCPVCVTDQAEIDAAIDIARGGLGHDPKRRTFRSCPAPGPVVVTFGDMIRVPGTRTSLEQEKAKGADVRVVYSALDGLRLAEAAPDRQFVFLGVGFETTAPTVAATVLAAQESGVRNFTVLPMFKTIPRALDAIASSDRVNVDGFILPGHVSTIIGTRPYEFLRDKYRLPSCVVGFEALDVLQGIYMLLTRMQEDLGHDPAPRKRGQSPGARGRAVQSPFSGHVPRPKVEIQYKRSVRPEGNEKAQQVMETVLEPCDAVWRGIGAIPGSGLTFRREFSEFDARKRFRIAKRRTPNAERRTACRCGDVMLGVIVPPECKLFAKACTPESPVGPCMVSTEGACAAYYKYERA